MASPTDTMEEKKCRHDGAECVLFVGLAGENKDEKVFKKKH